MNTKIDKVGQLQRKMFILGYNQSQVAKAVGVSRQSISDIVTGKKLPSIKLSKALAELFEMDEREFRTMLLSERAS